MRILADTNIVAQAVHCLRDAGYDAISLDMWSACVHRFRMGAMIQIRNVPEGLHRALKSRAALAGMSLSDFLLQEIRLVAARPTLDELRARLDGRPAATLSVAPAEAVRAERDRL